jgi:transaldolase
MSCDGVAVLDMTREATIACARRLVAEHDRNAEPVKIALTVY